jgi:hypothetical protein
MTDAGKSLFLKNITVKTNSSPNGSAMLMRGKSLPDGFFLDSGGFRPPSFNVDLNLLAVRLAAHQHGRAKWRAFRSGTGILKEDCKIPNPTPSSIFS